MCNLTLSDIEQEESGFVLNFYKGKSYQFGKSNIWVVSNLPNLSFNPAIILIVANASADVSGDTTSDLAFKNCLIFFKI